MARKGENIHKRSSDGRWEARCWYYNAKLDLWKYKYLYGNTYEAVKVKKEAFINSLNNPGIKNADRTSSVPQVILFTDMAEKWLDEMEKNKKKSTYVKYEITYRRYIKDIMQGITLDKITNVFVKENIFNGYLSKSISKSVYCVLNLILQFAAEHHSATIPKLKNPISQKHRDCVEALSHEEQAKLLPVLYDDMDAYKMAVSLDLHTGLRLGEICALKWSDIDFENRIIYVGRTVQRLPVENATAKTALIEMEPKTSYSKRKIPVSEKVVEMIGKFKNGGEYVFCGKKPMDPRTMEKHFSKILREAGIRHHRYHDIRHTFATNSVAEGTDIKSLSELLGHSSVNTTMNLYVHPTIDVKRRYMEGIDGYYSQFLE